MYCFNDDKFTMKILVYVGAVLVSGVLAKIVRARKIRITNNITVCTQRVDPLVDTITGRRTGHTWTLQYMLLRIHSLYIE